jgi:hypothetical protein
MIVSCSYSAALREREREREGERERQIHEQYDRQVEHVTVNMDIVSVRRLPQVGPLCNTFRDRTVTSCLYDTFTCGLRGDITRRWLSDFLSVRYSCVTSETALQL